MTIAVTLPNGEHLEMEVDQVEFVRVCRYPRCRVKFHTVNIDQVYHSVSCGVQAAKKKAALRKLGQMVAMR